MRRGCKVAASQGSRSPARMKVVAPMAAPMTPSATRKPQGGGAAPAWDSFSDTCRVSSDKIGCSMRTTGAVHAR